MNDSQPEIILSATPLKPAIVDSASTSLQVLVELSAEARPLPRRTPLSVCLVLDRSGSMGGGRLETCKLASERFIDMLDEDDEVGIVAYDDRVETIVSLRPAPAARREAALALPHLGTRGSTNLHAGWFDGASMLAPRATPERLCRVVLLSDGHANQGISDSNLIAQDVGQLARSGVSTTTIGVGSQFNEELMTAIARAGGGSAMYGNRPEDLHEPFEAELGLLRNIAWRDITVRIVSLSRGWRCENDYPADGTEEYSWRVPDIAAGAQAWLALSLPMSRAIDFATRRPRASLLKIEVRARASDGSVHLFKYRMPVLPTVDAAAWQAMPEAPAVARRFLETAAARLQDRAIKAVSRGEWDAVTDCLQQIERLAADHPWLRASVDEMRRLAERRDESLLSKELHYSARSMRSRLTERGESEYQDESDEASKAAYLRRKSMQGRGIGGR